MTSRQLFAAIGLVDEDLILQAAAKPRRPGRVLRRALPLAACLTLALLGALWWQGTPAPPAAGPAQQSLPAASPDAPATAAPAPQAEKKAEPAPREDANRLQPGDEVLIGREETNAPKGMDGQPLELAPTDDPKAARIREFLAGLMEHLQVEAVPDIYVSENGYKVILQGRGLGAIIGRRGETLDAIQQLTNYAVNHGQSKRVRIHIDAEGYRAKREESLQRLAVKVAGKVVKYRKNMTLEPMNAYERHVIHAALQDYPNVTTYSTGVEPNRRTVVAYAPGQK